MYIRTSFVCSTLRVSSIRIYILITGFVDPIMQHGVRSGMYLHLFSKENIWSNPHSCNNNSVDRIISKEEEREDPRRDSSIYLRVQIQWCFHIQSSNSYKNYKDLRIQVYSTRTTVFPHAIQQLQVILHTELILPQEILQLQGSSRADHYKASSSNCIPCLQAFYTAE